jgi:hypothetical protein
MISQDEQAETREKASGGPWEPRTDARPTPYLSEREECRCGCGRAPLPGRKFAAFACIARHRAQQREASGYDQNAVVTVLREQQAHLPARSWWVGVSRDDWAAAVAAERDRMTLTPLGAQIGWTLTAADVPIDRRVSVEGRL